MLPESTDPAERIARLVVHRHGLHPPVAVSTVLTIYADLETCDWPYECDAMTVGLSEARPTVFVRQGAPSRRARFTLAHELGHVVMGWHLGTVACNTSSSKAPFVRAGTAGVLSVANFLDIEREANTFASQLLMPWSYVDAAASYEDMDALLDAVEQTEMSAFAVLVGLARMLQPGFLFVFDPGDGSRREIASPRTEISTTNGATASHAQLRSNAKDSGSKMLANRRVRWYRFADFLPMPAHDGISSRELLAQAVNELRVGTDEARKRAKSLQSITAGLLSSLSGDEAQTLGKLRHRVIGAAAGDGLDEQLLDRYLVAKVRERFDKL